MGSNRETAKSVLPYTNDNYIIGQQLKPGGGRLAGLSQKIFFS